MQAKRILLQTMPDAALRARLLWGAEVKTVKLLPSSRSPNEITLTKHKVLHTPKGNPKGLIAKHEIPLGSYFVYYPPPSEFHKLVKSHASVEHYGPADRYPGSIGVIGIPKSNGVTEIRFVQANFKTGGKNGLRRSLAAKHGGWRYHLLKEAFLQAGSKGNSVSMGKHLVKPAVIEVFNKVAKELGWSVESKKVGSREILFATKKQ